MTNIHNPFQSWDVFTLPSLFCRIFAGFHLAGCVAGNQSEHETSGRKSPSLLSITGSRTIEHGCLATPQFTVGFPLQWTHYRHLSSADPRPAFFSPATGCSPVVPCTLDLGDSQRDACPRLTGCMGQIVCILTAKGLSLCLPIGHGDVGLGGQRPQALGRWEHGGCWATISLRFASCTFPEHCSIWQPQKRRPLGSTLWFLPLTTMPLVSCSAPSSSGTLRHCEEELGAKQGQAGLNG